MALFTVVLLAQVIFTSGPIGYEEWAGIFASQWMKVLTFSVIVALIYHVWVGIRDVFMDYIKPVGVRLALQAPDGKRLEVVSDFPRWREGAYPKLRPQLRAKYPGFAWP